MPSIGANGATIFSVNKASQRFVDYVGNRSAHSYEFPDVATTLQVDAVLDEVGQGSNAVEYQRNSGGVQQSTVISAIDAPTFDEGFASVNTQAHMKWVSDSDPRVKFVLDIPAVDFSLLTADRQQVNIAAGQGQAIYNAVVTALGSGWVYAQSWITGHTFRTKRPKLLPAAVEPEGAQLPSGLPDDDITEA